MSAPYILVPDDVRREIVGRLLTANPSLTRAHATEVADVGIHAAQEAIARVAAVVGTLPGSMSQLAAQVACISLEVYINMAFAAHEAGEQVYGANAPH